MTGRSAATSASATRATSRGSGAVRSRGAGRYWSGSGTSSPSTSRGISTSTGRGRPVLVEIPRSEEHTSELQSHSDLVCRLLLEKKKKNKRTQKTQLRHQHRCRHKSTARNDSPL